MLYFICFFLFLGQSCFADASAPFPSLKTQGPVPLIRFNSKSISHIYRTQIGEKIIHDFRRSETPFWVISLEESASEFSRAERLFNEFLNQHPEQFEEERKQDLMAEFIQQWTLTEPVDSLHPQFSFLTIRSSMSNKEILLSRLELLLSYPLGVSLFEDMKSCSNKLLIVDDKTSITDGGFAAAQNSTMDIFKPGLGADAHVRIRFDMPDHGTHLVKATDGTWIPFLAIDILFHELVHAKHIMCGTFSKYNGEKQAIEEENQFRKERGETQDWPMRDWRVDDLDSNQQIWFGL